MKCLAHGGVQSSSVVEGRGSDAKGRQYPDLVE